MGGKLAESIGNKFPQDIIQTTVNHIISQYKETFEIKTNNEITNLEKKYIWFTKQIHEFKSKCLKYYPRHWGVLCFIINEFSGELSIHVTKILSSVDQ